MNILIKSAACFVGAVLLSSCGDAKLDDEEYLMVTEGRGTWSLNGETREAKKGDILFARAWDYHGISAAPDSPLEFVVFKYSGRHITPPTDPNPELPEEQSP